MTVREHYTKVLDDYEDTYFNEECGEHSDYPMHRSDWLAMRKELGL